MSIGTSFKQQCPSCEALVPIRDPKLVGKKIECPKCKDKFIVQAPAPRKDEEDEDDPKAKSPAKAAPGKKPEKKTRPDEDEQEESAGKKKKGGTSRSTMGIALAVVGVLVLGVGGWLILGGKGGPAVVKSKGGRPNIPVAPDDPPEEKKKGGKQSTKEVSTAAPKANSDSSVTGPTADLTNLLPNDTDHVAHIPLRTFLDKNGPWRDALFQTPQGLDDDELRGKLGFSALAVDDIIHAEKYGKGAWSFTVIHVHDIIDQEAVKTALGLKLAPSIKNQTYFRASKTNPWFEQLAYVSVGVPRDLSSADKKANRLLHVHFHNPQTIIFADAAPMIALLEADKRFRPQADTGGTASKAATQKKAKDDKSAKERDDAKKTGDAPPDEKSDENPMPAQAAAPTTRLETYVTIKPALKSILETMEGLAASGKEKLLYASATDLNAARMDPAPGEEGSRAQWQPRQIWDVTLLLQDRNPQLRALGVAVVQKDDRLIQIRNELHSPLDNDARNVQQMLAEDIAPDIARFALQLLNHKIEVPKKVEAPPPTDPANPMPPTAPQRPGFIKQPDPTPKKQETTSKITVTQADRMVEFNFDLKLEASDIGKFQGVAALLSCGLEGAIKLLAREYTPHALAAAVKALPEKGLTDRNLAPGSFPPGAFVRPASSARVNREPLHRIGWMAGLLPFLGQDTLYAKINFNQSWRDPPNWAAAGTLVPQFLDPTYPPSSFYVARPGLPFGAAATHFVGIAGVGLDAADYDPNDPAVITKRGVMSYDKGISLAELSKGHGLSNTMVMVQVPPDSLAGITPWIAGGGSTLRGVPEKNSVAPFVSPIAGKDGKERRGTHAIMADGSVRFIDASVSDEVFKALATANMPLPDGYDLDAFDSTTPLIKAPKTTAPPAKKAATLKTKSP